MRSVLMKLLILSVDCMQSGLRKAVSVTKHIHSRTSTHARILTYRYICISRKYSKTRDTTQRTTASCKVNCYCYGCCYCRYNFPNYGNYYCCWLPVCRPLRLRPDHSYAKNEKNAINFSCAVVFATNAHTVREEQLCSHHDHWCYYSNHYLLELVLFGYK